MADLFRPGTTVPKGYVLEIVSWENDGDDYDTCFVKGIDDISLLNELLVFVQWFAHSSNDMGNDDILHEEILSRLWDCIKKGTITEAFFARFLSDVEYPTIGDDYAHDDWLDRVASSDGYSEVEDLVHSLIGYPVNYESNFARCVDNVRIYHFDQAFKVPDMPNPIKRISGAWSERANKEQWKL